LPVSRITIRLGLVGAALALLLVSGGIAGARIDAGTGARVATAAPTELFFSEYVEGSSNNKALELYNGTGAPVDLAAGGYAVKMYFNGSATAGLTIALSGTVASGDVFVLAQASASAAILAQADQTNASGWFNGDDAIELVKGATVVDSIGQVGFDPGTEWGTGLTSTADNTLRRKDTIAAGDPVSNDAFDPAVQWDGYPTDTFDGLGSHSVSGGSTSSTTTTTTTSSSTTTTTPAPSLAGVVISQVYGGGGNSGASYTNDFVELYNSTGSAVSLAGASVQYQGSTGTTWAATPLSGSIAAHGYYLVQEGAGAGGTTALPAPDAIGTTNLSATVGKVILVPQATAVTDQCPAARTDLVGFGAAANACVEGSGPASPPSNTSAVVRKGACVDTNDNASDFTIADPTPRNSSTAPGTPCVAAVVGTPFAIHDIQGASQRSPHVGEVVRTTGIVTAVSTNGFWIQDPAPDADAATSEGIFVFGSTGVAVGDSVRVDARVQEFRPGGATNGNLTTTELSGSPVVAVLSSGNPLPATTIVGPGGRTPPTALIEDDSSTGDVETSNTFDPGSDGLDFWESLEGMRVEIDDAVAVGPTATDFGETPVVSNGAAGVRTPRGGVIAQPGDFNPERVIVDDLLAPAPSMNVGDHYTSPVVGVLDYNFGNFFLEVTQTPTAVHDGVTPESTTAQGANQLAVATFNVENLDPTDGAAKFDRLAHIVVDNLKAPDLIGVEEVQDNDGAADSGNVDATVTLDTLVAAIESAGGPHYSYRLVNPVNDQDGGEPGGNIRVVFLYRTDRGLTFVDRPGATPTTANSVDPATGDLVYSPGRVDPTNAAWSSSRKPLAGEFLYNGQKLFVITNHFNSKGGDDPLMGHRQPPQFPSETQRHQQATLVRDFTRQILAANPGGKVVVLGDLNDFQFSETVGILKDTPLHDLIETLPVNEQYSYDFEGNSETLDHILLSDALFAAPRSYDIVHVNSEFFDQASDHDPQVVRLTLAPPNHAPTVSAGGPYSVDEGGTVTLHATGSDADGDTLTYAWDLDGDGQYDDAVGANPAYAAGDGPATVAVSVQASDGTATASDSAQVTVANVAPTGTFNAPGSADSGSTFAISITSPSDPSAADRAALQYAFDCGTGYGAYGSANSATCTAGAPGSQIVHGRIRDKDGGVTTYDAAVAVMTPESKYQRVCDQVRAASSSRALADSICVALAVAEKQDAAGHKVAAHAVLTAAEVLVRVGHALGAFTSAEQAQLIAAIRAL
jgi:predicted extracellular nuclease